eukprot:1187011-Prorocentrum_minimum.AAC.5
MSLLLDNEKGALEKAVEVRTIAQAFLPVSMSLFSCKNPLNPNLAASSSFCSQLRSHPRRHKEAPILTGSDLNLRSSLTFEGFTVTNHL